jgi:hypothetical protein
MPHGYNRSNLDFKNILKQFGVSSLNKFMGDGTGLTSESEPDSAPPQQQQPVTSTNQPAAKPEVKGNIQQRVGLIEQIMNENRQAQKQRAEKEQKNVGVEDMLEQLK